MSTLLFFVRHAQSHPQASVAHSEWPLSDVGCDQAEELAVALDGLGIEVIYSSPFKRCIDTISPFARRSKLEIERVAGLRERHLSHGLVDDFEELWRRSWDDFDYALPGCESSRACQQRMVETVDGIVATNEGRIVALGCHGNATGLYLNAIDSAFGREEAEEVKNPDVLRVDYNGSVAIFDRSFRLESLLECMTDNNDTPVQW